MSPEFIQRLKTSIEVSSDVGMGYEEDKGKLGKVLSLCSLRKGGYVSTFGEGRLEGY